MGRETVTPGGGPGCVGEYVFACRGSGELGGWDRALLRLNRVGGGGQCRCTVQGGKTRGAEGWRDRRLLGRGRTIPRGAASAEWECLCLVGGCDTASCGVAHLGWPTPHHLLTAPASAHVTPFCKIGKRYCGPPLSSPFPPRGMGERDAGCFFARCSPTRYEVHPSAAPWRGAAEGKDPHGGPGRRRAE